MEIDPILKIKLIYFLEKRAELKEQGNWLFDPEYARPFYITSGDISTVTKILKSKGIYKLETKFRTVLDRRGTEEIAGSEYEEEYWEIHINEDLLKKHLLKLKVGLREYPSLKKEQITQILRQILNIFSKHNLEQVIFLFHSPYEVNKYIYIKRSDLNYFNVFDILLGHAFSKEVPLSSVLAEFLNPIYYNIGDEAKQKQLFDFIDKIFSFCIDKKDQDDWREKASKYIIAIQKKKKLDRAKIEFTRESVIFGDITMPIESGLKKIFKKLYETPQIYKDEKLTEQGKSVELSVLQEIGSYKNESSFRRALGSIRAKLIKHKLPIEIVNESTKHYMMEIKYS